MLQAVGLSLCKQFRNVVIKEINVGNNAPNLLSASSVNKLPCRTTYILRRKHPVQPLKKYVDPKSWVPNKRRHKVYELVELTEVLPQTDMKVLLKTLVPGIGEKGDVVSVRRSFAYEKLLLTGLAEYATPEAIEEAAERSKIIKDDDKEERFSSLDVHRTMNILRSLIVSVVMHQENKWVLEPWHVRASFRKAGVHMVSDDCIEMPKKKIEGPDMNLENKEFLVTITINKKEKVKVRCRLHHWHPDIMKRAPYLPLFWTKPAEPIFEEEAEILAAMPLPPVPKSAVIKNL